MLPARRPGLRSLLLPVLAVACRSPQPAAEPRSAAHARDLGREEHRDPSADRPERELPAGWSSGDPHAFELLLERELPVGGVTWSAAARAELESALARQDVGAVRAAVLLAHDPGEATTECLLARLEARRPAPSRALDAGDLVAAAALEGRVEDPTCSGRLLALATGATAHPDLEVRVECACVVLGNGEDAVVPFLLRVLRVETPDEGLDPPDWEPVRTLYWSKHRAAGALARRARVPMRFRPDASYEDQAQEAERLALALVECGALER